MIVNIRGTNGAGKSTIVRTIMELYPEIKTMQYPKHEGKKVPMGYICSRDQGTRNLFIPGHYQIANGGIDTMPSMDYAQKLMLSHHEFGADVLAEGKNFNDGVQWLVCWYGKKLDVRVVFIDHPVMACIKAVRERGHSIKEETIIRLADKSEKEYRTLLKVGMTCVSLPREEALDQIKHWLGVNHVSQ
jgi:energy-coupling factor transporter ATP-binding protein EcfA2